jgi:hypothetical protein
MMRLVARSLEPTPGHCRQFYDFSRRFADVGVHDSEIELILGREFDARGLEPTSLIGCVLCAATGQPPDEFIPGWREQKDQYGIRNLGSHRSGALEIDLKKDSLAR